MWMGRINDLYGSQPKRGNRNFLVHSLVAVHHPSSSNQRDHYLFLLCVFSRSLDTLPVWVVLHCQWSKASKTRPKSSNTLHLHIINSLKMMKTINFSRQSECASNHRWLQVTCTFTSLWNNSAVSEALCHRCPPHESSFARSMEVIGRCF